jgi:hypothetical protein
MSYNAWFSYCAFGNGEVAGCIAACTNLLEGFVVNETRSVFGDLELTFLDLLAKFPVRRKRSYVNTLYLTNLTWESECLLSIMEKMLSTLA